jgi:hypothetical protein
VTWHAVFLAVDIACLFAAGALFAGAPGFWQRSALAWYWAGFLILAVGRGIGLHGDAALSGVVLDAGRGFVTLGVMASLFRLFYVDQERRCLKYSPRFHR